MVRHFITASLAAFLLMPAARSLAAEAEPEPSSGADVERVIVSGQRPEGLTLRNYMLNFVNDIGDPISKEFGFARWRKNVCIGVHNLGNAEAAQYIADRVSAIALELGLRPGAPGCSSNIQIVFTTDGRAMAEEIVAKEPQLFRPFYGTGGTTQGSTALLEFTASDAPVRWWQLTMVVNRAGLIAIELPRATGRMNSVGSSPSDNGGSNLVVPNALQGLDGVPWTPGSNSRITNSVKSEIWNSFLIVDFSKVTATGASWKQLADYLAMVALAQIDPHRSPSGYDSILNLFSARSQADGLTQMDFAYLRALYTMDAMRVPDAQRGLLATTMMRVQESTASTVSE